MVKKIILTVFGFILLISLINGILAANIGYIIKTPETLEPDETYIRNLLVDDGNSVDIIDDDSIIIADLYDIIIVGKKIISVENMFDNKEYKTLFFSQSAAKNAGLAKYSGTTTGDRLTIYDNEHFITEGFPLGERKLYEEDSNSINYLYGCKAINSRSLLYKSYDWDSSLLVLEKDSLLLDDSRECSNRNVTISERNLFFGLPEANYWRPDTEVLFLNSIDWLLHGSDGDDDGFYYDDDCDDENSDIYPGADEIPYDGIDQDCDGYDLTDYDEDGYDSIVVGGDDCDDGDETINPGSEDIYKNCMNDAPVIEPITKITVFETETVEISVDAVDAEDDSIFYSINDTRFNQDDNMFSWETGYYDSGNYFFTITASDGELESETEVEVEVKNANQVPVCDEIPDVEWTEDQTTSLDLKNYCHDPDNDPLEFYVNNTSDNDYIYLDSFEDGVAVFSSAEDWNGEDWIIFLVYDGKDYSLTDEITLMVLPDNDAPVLENNLQNITWNEDVDLIDYIDLNDYFSDVDSLLNFEVIGNYFIDIIINNGLVSLYPQEDWFGSENVFFNASDGEFTVSSNAINLTVIDQNEPPEFGDINCQLTIEEDTSYDCELNASDEENDIFWFEIENEENLNCDIDGNNIEYISKKDYNGDANCLIRVYDDYGYNQYLLEVNVTGVNDPPEIKTVNPPGDPKIMENFDFLFGITTEDVDSKVDVLWFLDGVEVGSGNTYLFNQQKGNYLVKVNVTDGEFSADHLWNVFVGNISDFTCEEVNGYICKDNEVCREDNLLNVSDSNINTCCSVPCSPSFKRIDRCEVLEDNIEIDIKDPDDGDDFDINDLINVEIDVKNDLEEDLDFDVEAYLYDLTDDDEIDEYEDNLDVDENDKEKLEFDLEIPEDLDDDNDFDIFVKVSDDDYCNEDYAKINIKRKKHEVVIEDFKIEPLEVECGDYLYADTKIKNLGSRDEDVYIVIENNKLGIKEQTPEFEIEKYDDDDEAKDTFEIKVPENAQEGDYDIKATVFFDDGNEEYSVSSPVKVTCKNLELKTTTTETETQKITLEGNGKEAIVKDEGSNIRLIAVLVILLVTLIVIFILLAWLFYY